MYLFVGILKPIVAAFLLVSVFSLPAWSDDDRLDELFAELQSAEPRDADSIENRIWAEWSKSGSASMDLLLQRGRDAMEADDVEAAVGHFSALIDHAPEFAEGYNARAMAFYRMKLYGPAIEDIGHALELNERHFGALSGLALILQELGFEQDALEVWRTVEALHPHHDDAGDAIEMLERLVEGSAL